MTIKELVEKYGFEELSEGVYRLNIDDVEHFRYEKIELYQINKYSVYVRHEHDFSVTTYKSFGHLIDRHIRELLGGSYYEED